MNDHGIHTSDAIALGFPHPVLLRIDEPPARVDIHMAQEMQTEKAASHPSTRGSGIHGHAAMVVPPARYSAEYSNVAYIWEVNPGEGPVFPANVTAASARTLKNDYAISARVFQDQTRTHTALNNQLYRRYPTEYCTGLIKPGIGIATVSLLQIYTHLYKNFGNITDEDLEESRAGITGQYDFTTRSMPQFLHRVLKAQQLHRNAIPPRPIADNEEMGISYLNFQRSGTYPLD